MGALLPGGFIPTEDQGMIYVNVTTPPGATVDRTETVMNEIDALARKEKSVETVSTLSGYSLVTEVSGSSYGMGMINLVPWKDRDQSVSDLIAELEEKTKHIMDAKIEFFPPPTVPGFGNSSGFELRMLDRSGKDDINAFSEVVHTFMADLESEPEIGTVFTSFETNFPQYLLHVDYDQAAKQGITVENAMSTLQTLMGSFYATNFIRYGQMYKVMVQASAEYRQKPEDVLKLFVKNDKGEMVTFSTFMRMERVYGPEQITRYNMYASAMLNGDAAAGFSSGQVIEAVERIAAEKLPAGYTIEWSGMTKEQKASGNQAIYVFAICLLFVYLLLCAQYESFTLPLPVLLSLPAGIFGAFLFLKVSGLDNNIYAQVAMIMLIGLLGKNAILIIEYAVLKNKQGMPIAQAAVEGAVARLRPILMTSFAFAAGLVPLALSSGAGAIGNRSIGLSSLGGMLIGTVFGVIIIPGLYALFSRDKKQSKKVIQGTTLVISALILFGSCKVQSDVRQQYVPTKIALDSTATDTLLREQMNWKNFFKDPLLKKLIDSAISNNLDLAEAVQRIEFAKSQFRIRKSAQMPAVDLAVDASLTRFGKYTVDGVGIFDGNLSENIDKNQVIPNPMPEYFVGLRSTWELDIWGKLKNLKGAAYHEFLASYEGKNLIQSELVAELASRYYDLISLDAELASIRENIAIHQQSLDIIEVMKNAGTTNSLGVNQFEAALYNAKAQEQKSLQLIVEIESEINQLLGAYQIQVDRASFETGLDQVFVNFDLGNPDKMLAHRPDIRQASLNLIAAGLEADAAKANLYPSLIISPQIGLNSFRIEQLFNTASLAYSVVGGLTTPLLNRTAAKATYEQYKSNYGTSFVQYERTVLKAWHELFSQLQTQQFVAQRHQMFQKEAQVLREAVETSNSLFLAGRASYLDVLSAQKSVLTAKLNAIQSKKDNIQIELNIYKALGGGW